MSTEVRAVQRVSLFYATFVDPNEARRVADSTRGRACNERAISLLKRL
jgi:hypothetical protein